MRSRSTIRWRLTAFYSLMFLLSGATLLLVSFLLVQRTLIRSEQNADQIVIDKYGFDEAGVQLIRGIPVPVPPTGQDAEIVGDVLDGVQQDVRAETLRTLVIGMGVTLLPLVGVSLLVGWLAAGRTLRPVGRLTSRARAISQESLHERIELEGANDELKELADTLDSMLERIEAAFDAQRGFAANISHELRTPLSVIRAEADLVLDDPTADGDQRAMANRVAIAAGRAEALLESLLALARSESTMADRSPVDVAELAGDVVTARITGADRAGISVDIELGKGTVEGDRWLLERLIANLVDNAIAYNNRGGWLHVEVDTFGAEVVLSVANTGDQLSADQVDQILKPFHRASSRSRPGYGLGMAIALSVAEAHDGTLTVRARPSGGLDVEVRLPSAGGRVPGRPPSSGHLTISTPSRTADAVPAT